MTDAKFKKMVEEVKAVLKRIYPNITEWGLTEWAEWLVNYNYTIFIVDNIIIVNDLELKERNETQKELLVREWIQTLENKYNYNKESDDRKICGDDYINNTIKLIDELKSIAKSFEE